MKFGERGSLDNRPSPPEILAFIERHGYVDACTGEADFLDPHDPMLLKFEKLYCNPPFSMKKAFVKAAVKRHLDLGQAIAMLLPLDPSTSWFKMLLRVDASIVVLPRRLGRRGRYPGILAFLGDNAVALEALAVFRGFRVCA